MASRLVEKTGRPVIVVSIDEHGEGKGSGRSVQGFNLHACIASCEDLLLRFGGHAMAAGLSVREENLPELRRRLNEWAARECPVLVTPPLECDLSIHLDRITVESVRRLDQLAPYGAENPAPVFLLEKAVVEGVYPVSEGRHCRLRLRQGNACIYAVWFGMHPEQLPYATGDVVDAALSLSVYEAARGAQLSGRILELHPAGFGNAAAQQTALVQALRRGSPLTAQQRALIAPERSDIITVYRELQARRWHAEDMQPLFAKLGEEHTGKTLVALTALEQVGLIAAVERGGAKFWELVPTAGKKNLADAPHPEMSGGVKNMPEGKKPAEDLYSAKTHLHQPVPEVSTVNATALPADAPEGALPSEVRPEIVTWEKLCEAIKASGKAYNMEMITKAYDLANKAHNGVCRRSGEPYICHPLAVARLVLDLGMDSESIAAALLHDVVEDTPHHAGGPDRRLWRGSGPFWWTA